MSDTAVTVDTSSYDLAVRRFVTDLHLSIPLVVRTTARQLFQELLRLTFPKTQAQGRAAVKRDISRAAWLLDPAKIHNQVLAQAVQDQEFEVVQAFIAMVKREGGFLGRFQLEHFASSLHESARDKRGRVTRSQNVAVLDRSEYNSYVRRTMGHVGATKSEWGVAAQRLGAAVPQWILGHSSHGEMQEDNHPTNPSVTVVNRGPGIDSLSRSVVQTAINRRTDAMTRDVEQVLAGRASRYFP